MFNGKKNCCDGPGVETCTERIATLEYLLQSEKGHSAWWKGVADRIGKEVEDLKGQLRNVGNSREYWEACARDAEDQVAILEEELHETENALDDARDHAKWLGMQRASGVAANDKLRQELEALKKASGATVMGGDVHYWYESSCARYRKITDLIKEVEDLKGSLQVKDECIDFWHGRYQKLWDEADNAVSGVYHVEVMAGFQAQINDLSADLEEAHQRLNAINHAADPDGTVSETNVHGVRVVAAPGVNL